MRRILYFFFLGFVTGWGGMGLCPMAFAQAPVPMSVIVTPVFTPSGVLTPAAGITFSGATPVPAAPAASTSSVPVSAPSPVVLEPTAVPAPTLKQYVIQQDDTLWDLAGDFYGKPWLWPLFLKFNSIPNPDLIHPGQALLFPSEEVLLGIQNKTPQQVTQERESMEKQTTPVVVAAPPAAPVTQTPLPAATPQPVITAAAPPPTPSPTPLKTPTFKVTGSKTINFTYAEATGNSTTGITNTGYDRHETLTLHMEGQLNDGVKITGNFAQSDLALQDQYDLTLSTKHWELYFGDLPAALPGSEFLSSNLSTTGLKLTGQYDNWDLTALYATPQGRPIYEKFFGNQTQGPYLIPDLPLVPGSEIVWVNKQKMTRGVDYTLDYTVGQLTFNNRILQLTDLIEVQAESSSSAFNTQIYGYHTEVALMGKVNPPLPTSAGGGSQGLLYNRAVTTVAGLAPSLAGLPGMAGSSGVSGIGSPGVLGTAGTGVTTVGLPGSAGVSLNAPVPVGGGAAPVSTSVNSPQWIIGQGYMRQFEQPDFNVTTTTGQVATDTQMMELDSTLNLGPALKLNGEIDGSLLTSSDTGLAPNLEGAAYSFQGESFRGDFHFLGKVSGASPNFTSIGNPLTSGNFLDWMAQADYKTGANFYAQADRTYQRSFALGFEDDTTTDHGEVKDKPKGFPEFDYIYYNSQETQENPSAPFAQGDLRNTASLIFALPASLSLKTSALQESQTGTSLGENNSYGGQMEISSVKWPRFNFDLSGEWKLTDIEESGTNTLVAQSPPGNNIPSQTYTFTMEGKPVDHLTLTGKGSYSNAPPGPTQAEVSATYQTDPLKWLNSNGSYSLQFEQTQALGNTVPEDVHIGSGSLDVTPLSWMKLTTQPSFQLDILNQYYATISENLHQYYKAALTPDFGSFNTDYTLDQFWTWDSSTQGFPLNFSQRTETINVAAQKPLGKVSLQASYKRTDQNQQNISLGTNTTTDTLTQTETDSLAWNADAVFTFTFGHSLNLLNQYAPGQGNIANPLLPNGADTFNTTYPTTSLNAFTVANTFTLKVAEQLSKELSIYEQGGYTRTEDQLEGGTVYTYSPAAGFTWRPGSFLSWTASYQYNGSSGEVDTDIQTAQTTLTASLNQAASLSLTWNWSEAEDPYVLSQQGNVSYTMNF